MYYSEAKPCQELARVVECYWFLTGDGSERQPRRVVPDGRAEIILNFARPFAQLTANGWRLQGKRFFAGQITGPLLLRPTGRFHTVGIRLKPAAARALIDQPMSSLTDRIVPWGRRLRLPQSRTTDKPTGPKATDLDVTLLPLLLREPDPRLEAAVDHLIKTAGAASPIEAAKLAGWTPRHLQRRFLEEVGLTPRVFARMQRFQKVFRAFEETGNSWVRTALECGYFDQGHLIRDFRDLAGQTPAALTRPSADLAEFFLQHRKPSMSLFSRTPPAPGK
jgi:AraC-like DNA-binding protein